LLGAHFTDAQPVMPYSRWWGIRQEYSTFQAW